MCHWGFIAFVFVLAFSEKYSNAAIINVDDGRISGKGDQDVYKKELACDKGWFRFANSCYLFSSEKKEFRLANLYCRQNNSTLFYADNMAEFLSIVKMAPPQYIFTHFKKDLLAEDNTWRKLKSHGWETRYFFWENDEAYRRIAVCLVVNTDLSADEKKLFNVPCTYRYSFYCERNSTLLSGTKLAD